MDIIPAVSQVMQLMKEVLDEENCEVLQPDLTRMQDLLLDITSVFQPQGKETQEAIKIWLQLVHNCLIDAKSILHRYSPSQRQRCVEFLICKPGKLFKEIKEWKVLFDFLFHRFQEDFSLFVTSASHQIIKRDPMHLEESTEGQTLSAVQESVQALSEDEAWMVFRRIAFKDNPVPTDIEEYAKNMVDECKGSGLAITLVAAAMRGKGTVDEWETSSSSIKSHAYSSSGPDTLHPQVYPLLRWSYDALPNSHIKNCFLYCAMYPKGAGIPVQELVQMWVAEGLARSKQKTHLMDMAIGQSYVNVLVDRCFFQNITRDKNHVDNSPVWAYPEGQCIRVQHAVREMAVYIGEEEENCLLKADQGLQNFPTIFHNEDCKRISVFKNDIKSLPAVFTCPKLVSLMLSLNHSIEEVPPGFLFSLTSLKVLHLRWSSISSIPSSVGQLKQLEFLSLRGPRGIRDLPEEIGRLSSLQILDLEGCSSLQSLPPKIGELKNLKHLSLKGCWGLKVIPHEISQLISLTTLDADRVELSVEAESEASIWRLKDLSNLAMLRIYVRSPGIEEGIMGTWLDMRHLHLSSSGSLVDLPQDMKKMSKLQLFAMESYGGSSLPDYICKFQHLQAIQLDGCSHLRELSHLERVQNLKALRLANCKGLKELGIGNSGGFLMLEILTLYCLWGLESIGEASNNGVWNESTLPRLRMLGIFQCPKLKRFPRGMEKLPNLTTIFAQQDRWRQIIWEDGHTQIRLQKLYKEW